MRNELEFVRTTLLIQLVVQRFPTKRTMIPVVRYLLVDQR